MRPLLLALLLCGPVAALTLPAQDSGSLPAAESPPTEAAATDNLQAHPAGASDAAMPAPTPSTAPADSNAAAPGATVAAPPEEAPAAAPREAPPQPAETEPPTPVPAGSEAASASPLPASAAPESVAPQNPPPAGRPVATPEANLELAARLSVLEQILVAQKDREFALLQETNRVVILFSVAFAVIGLVALIAAGWLAFRSVAVAAGAPQTLDGVTFSSGNLLPPAGRKPLLGMDRVKSSGQRFQTRMTDLEQRLNELEHIASRGGPGPAAGTETLDPAGQVSVAEAAAPQHAPFAETQEQPLQRVIPRAAILVRKAETLTNMGKLAEAHATLDEAAGLEPDRAELLIARGQVFEKQGRLGDALAVYDKAVGLEASNTGALLMKAGVLNRQERYGEALVCYERALEIHRATT